MESLPKDQIRPIRSLTFGSMLCFVLVTGAHAQTAPIISTVAESGPGGVPATAARLAIRDIVLDGAGNIHIASALDHRIYRVDPSGVLTVVAATGIADSLGGRRTDDSGPPLPP